MNKGSRIGDYNVPCALVVSCHLLFGWDGEEVLQELGQPLQPARDAAAAGLESRESTGILKWCSELCDKHEAELVGQRLFQLPLSDCLGRRV